MKKHDDVPRNPIRIYLRPEQHSALKALASAEDRSVSAEIRRAIDLWIEVQHSGHLIATQQER